MIYGQYIILTIDHIFIDLLLSSQEEVEGDKRRNASIHGKLIEISVVIIKAT